MEFLIIFEITISPWTVVLFILPLKILYDLYLYEGIRHTGKYNSLLGEQHQCEVLLYTTA